MAPLNEMVLEDLNNKWEGSSAKILLQRIVENDLDKNKEDGKKKRANIVYKMRDEFVEFPQKFFTKKLQTLREPTKKQEEIDFEEVVDLEELEQEWEESRAKVVLERLVEEGQDKKEDGNNMRAKEIYSMMREFKDFPQKFFTEKLQKLRKGKAPQSEQDIELRNRWENSRAKVVLERLVQHGFDCTDNGGSIRTDKVYKMREEFKQFPQAFFTRQLKILRKGKPKPPAWKNSRARVILQDLLVVGMDCDDEGNDLPVLTIYEMDGEFKRFPLKRFAANLEDLREIVHEAMDKSLRDSLAVDDFLEKHPPSTMDAWRCNYKRYPKWQGSDAQKLLRHDLKILLRHKILFKGKAGVLPKDLWAFRDKYQDFPLVIFRNHIYKEIIHDKQVAWNNHIKNRK
jgi:predicted transcriptional regulator